jgi:tRNA (cytidine/uridine-2'-O-)-methyltransferase
LHLIRPYGFFLNDRKVKRSGLDYWQHLKLVEHDSYEDFIKQIKNGSHLYYITRYGVKTPEKLSLRTRTPVYFIFGKESSGLSKKILEENKTRTIRIPASKNVRSLNLSNCVAILGYEYAKQNNYDSLSIKEPHKPIFN